MIGGNWRDILCRRSGARSDALGLVSGYILLSGLRGHVSSFGCWMECNQDKSPGFIALEQNLPTQTSLAILVIQSLPALELKVPVSPAREVADEANAARGWRQSPPRTAQVFHFHLQEALQSSNSSNKCRDSRQKRVSTKQSIRKMAIPNSKLRHQASRASESS